MLKSAASQTAAAVAPEDEDLLWAGPVDGVLAVMGEEGRVAAPEVVDGDSRAAGSAGDDTGKDLTRPLLAVEDGAEGSAQVGLGPSGKAPFDGI